MLLDYIRDHQLNDCVTFLGNLPEERVLEEYGKCAVVALTSFEESAGMVLQQAMAAGVPVVATDVGGIPCIVTDGVTGFIVKLGNIEDLAQKIAILLNDENLRSDLGRRAKEEARERFTAEVIAKRAVDVYRRVIAG